MSKTKAWSIPINLDEFTPLFFHLHGAQEHSEFLVGFLTGLHGAPQPGPDTEATRLGHTFGASSREAVDTYIERCRAAGKKGGNPALTRGLTVRHDDLDIFDEPPLNGRDKGLDKGVDKAGITRGINITSN